MDDSGYANRPAFVLALDGVSKVFGTTVALWNVDFSVRRGEAIGVLGGNGSGKSTLLRVLAGLAAPDAGTRRCTSADTGSEVRVSLLGHASHLFDELTVAENIALGARGPFRDRGRRLVLLDALGLDVERNRRVAGLSAGTRRRAGLARALATDPDVLLVDEPFTMLDEAHAASVRAVLADVAGGGLALVVAAHGADGLRRLCPRTVHLAAGHVVEQPSGAPRVPA